MSSQPPVPYPLPPNEVERLEALRDYHILDTLPEQSYNDIVAIAAYICQTPISLITLVDKDRQWFKARHGLDASETPRELSMCTYAIAEDTSDGIFNIPDASRDNRFEKQPYVTGAPHVRFYAGVPLLTPSGLPLGTLCVVDSKPRLLSSQQQEVLKALARQVMMLLEMTRQKHTLELVLEENQRVQTELLGQNAIFQNSLEGIARFDSAGNLTMANDRFASAFIFTPEELIGRHWSDLISPEQIPSVRQLLETLAARGRTEVEAQGTRKDGGIIDQHLTLVPIVDTDQQFVGHYCFMRDVTDHKVRERRLVRGAYYDELTGLANRAAIMDRIQELLARMERRSDYQFALLYIDLDKFKSINDTLGHAAGDAVLMETARRLQACIRPDDLAGRLGGDEFVVLLDGIVDNDSVEEICQRIDQSMKIPLNWHGHSIPISMSIGKALSKPGQTSMEVLLGEADSAMYRAKHKA